jgi:hypothetical protein
VQQHPLAVPSSLSHPSTDGCEVDSLLQSIAHLKLHEIFNSHIENGSLPLFLTHLTFGALFNQPVDSLPPRITHLAFGREFHQKVDSLPPKLIHLFIQVCATS